MRGFARFAWRGGPVLLALALLLAACAQTAPSGPPAGPAATSPAATEPATRPAAKVSEVKIGVIYPLSGSQAPTGIDMKNGVELATEIVNGKYDLDLPLAKEEGLPNLGGARLVTILGDHQGVPEKGLSETERLITGERVVAVVGAYNSAVTATASQAAERLGTPFLNPESSSPTLIQQGYRWFFRTTPDDETFAENFLQFLDDVKKKKNVNISRLALIYENTLFGKDVAKYVKQFADKYKYDIVADISYAERAAEVTSEVQRAKQVNPDVLIMASYISDAILYTQQLKQQDVNVPILAMDAGYIDSAYLKTVAKDGEYILSREVWAKDLQKARPVVKTVNDMYKNKYGVDMNGNSARTVTGILTLADAINRAGSTEPEKIRAALMATDIPASQLIMPWDGIKFDQRGQNTLGRGIIVQVQNGEYTTVWPFDLTTKELVWPVPAWSQRE
jgi:branched-chain amino acid transport system substrate-binding protein